MILKKPYAFLVKHFRMIHVLLLLCASYLMYKSWNIASFFEKYVSDNLRVYSIKMDELASTYVTIPMFIVSFAVFLLAGIILYLMKHKKKPIFFYLYIMLTYVIIIISYFYARSFLSGLEYNLPDLRVVNVIKDIYKVLCYIQIPILGIVFLRAIGFDLSKFDFKKDLLDLGIEEEDSEEYEFELKFDGDSIKSNAKKGLRYFKYFYKENKFLFVIFGFAIIIIAFTLIINSVLSKEKIYSQSDVIDIGGFKAKILETYKTNADVKGNKINSKYYYLIAKVRLDNKSGYNSIFNKGLMRLSYSEFGSTIPTTEVNSKFTEFGVNYYSQIIKAGETRDFVFIFEIPIENYDNELMLKYLMSVKYNKGNLKYDYKKVKLNPIELPQDMSVEKVDEKSLGEELTFKDSVLGDTKIVINDVKFADTFSYDVVKCNSSGCATKNNFLTAPKNSSVDLMLMRVDYNITYDNETLGKKYNNKTFLTTYGSIRFEVNGKEYNNRFDLVDMTPYYTGRYSFLQVREKVSMADKIYLDFTIRDKLYTYIIKDVTKVKEG